MAQYRAAVRAIERAKRESDADISEGMVEAAEMISLLSLPRLGRRHEHMKISYVERRGDSIVTNAPLSGEVPRLECQTS
jgi:hypothetical protein